MLFGRSESCIITNNWAKNAVVPVHSIFINIILASKRKGKYIDAVQVSEISNLKSRNLKGKWLWMHIQNYYSICHTDIVLFCSWKQCP